MKTTRLALAACFGFLVLCAPIRAMAQSTDISQQNIPTLEMDRADVREALRALFKNVGASYSIASDVQGNVTTSLKNVTFEAALQNILKQVDATYRVEAGVYLIIKREPIVDKPVPEPVKGEVGDHKQLRRLKVRSIDPELLILMLSGAQSTSNAPEMSTIANTKSAGVGGGFGNGNNSGGLGNNGNSGNRGSGGPGGPGGNNNGPGGRGG